MGVKQSKRSVDITETSTKGEIEGFGNEGKVEKIVDGVVEKVAANGHVDGDLQNGAESHQNGVEPVQNGEAAVVAAKNVIESKEDGESPAEAAVNGLVENGEINGEAEKSEDEKKDGKKDKKKDKKEKVVKKKFSFRNFSFSKKDKSKPPKEDKSPAKVDEAEVEEAPKDAEKEETLTLPKQDDVIEKPKVEEVKTQEPVVNSTIVDTNKAEVDLPTEELTEKMSNIASKSKEAPPPLPASPPPSEPVDIQMTSESPKEPTKPNMFGSFQMNDVASSISEALNDKIEATTDAIKDAEEIAIKTGKQIEEKATDLLRTVEERAEESMKTAGEAIAQKTEEVIEALGNTLSGNKPTDVEIKTNVESELKEATGKAEEKVLEKVENLDSSIGEKMEEAVEKPEECGAGESLADMPKDLVEEVTAATIEATNPDSLECSLPPPPPPVVEAVTGE